MADVVARLHAHVRASLARFSPGVWAVACSGGADSIALLHAVAQVGGAERVVALHVDHGLQPAAANFVATVTTFCAQANVALLTRRVAVPVGASREAQAREARYAALFDMQRVVGAPYLATAHHLDDQAETVLMRVLRGTGPGGVAAMPPAATWTGQAAGCQLIRPLLDVPRAWLVAYTARLKLPTCDDPMNLDATYFRTRVRHRLLPALRAENPNLTTALAKLASQTRDWQTALEFAADRECQANPGIMSSATALAQLPVALRVILLRRLLVAADLPVTASSLTTLDQAVQRPPHGELQLPVTQGVAQLRYGQLTLRPLPPRSAVDEPAEPDGKMDAGLAIAWRRDAGAASAAGGSWLIRHRLPGDRMRPARLAGKSRKLADLFIDAKVPASVRATARLVVNAALPNEIWWAEGIGHAHLAPVAVSVVRAAPQSAL